MSMIQVVHCFHFIQTHQQRFNIISIAQDKTQYITHKGFGHTTLEMKKKENK